MLQPAASPRFRGSLRQQFFRELALFDIDALHAFETLAKVHTIYKVLQEIPVEALCNKKLNDGSNALMWPDRPPSSERLTFPVISCFLMLVCLCLYRCSVVT